MKGGVKIEQINLLIREFERIKRKGWIKSISDNTSGVGRTFENELGIFENNFPYADYYNIELKCTTKKKFGYINLFSAEPNTKETRLIEDIAKHYGYPDKNFVDTNILNTSINSKVSSFISFKYKATIYIDEKNKYLKVLIEDYYGRVVDDRITWDTEYLKEKIADKCKIIALIKAEKRRFNDVLYIKYKELSVYELKDVKKIIKNIENGNIRITFKVSVNKKGIKKGKLHNHGTSFEININKIEELFTKVH